VTHQSPTLDGEAPVIAAFTNLDEAEAVIAWCGAFARPLNRPVKLAYILDPGSVRDPVPVASAIAHDMLMLLTTDDRLAGLAVSTTVEAGLADEELPRLANEHPEALLLMASSEHATAVPAILRGGDAGAGVKSLTSAIAIVPPKSPAPPAISRVVIGTDRSELSDSILERARVLAEGLAVQILTVEAVEPGSASIPDFLATSPTIGESHVILRGRAGATLLAVARARGAEVIIVGSTGRGRMARVFLGSTAQWLARHSDRPVVFVPRVP